MKRMKIIEPHRPYLVLRHISGLEFRYKSWAALKNCDEVKPYYRRAEKLDHSHFRKPDDYHLVGDYREGRQWVLVSPLWAPFSLRWDNGDPVSTGDKLFDESHNIVRRAKFWIGKATREKRHTRVTWKNKSRVKRHLHYLMDVCREEGEPPLRKKAAGIVRSTGYCDYDEDYRLIQKCWKSQSKRKHQWRSK